MLLGGVSVEDRLVLRLARVVGDGALAGKLNMAYTLRSAVLNLTYSERQTILDALEGGASGLSELRAELLSNPAWQLRQRL